MVLQETWLRSGTIRDNIVMGKPDATDEEVIAAAKASHAHSFIKRLPQGYDTVMAEAEAIFHRDRNSCFALHELCYVCRQC